MDKNERDILSEVRTDIKWLVRAYRDDIASHKEFYGRLNSLESTRQRAKGGTWVIGIGSSIAATAYALYTRMFGV